MAEHPSLEHQQNRELIVLSRWHAFFSSTDFVYLSMIKKKEILARIKQSVQNTEPQATVILYGSFARGDEKEFSDIDILILLDQEKITYSDETRIKYPLYDLEYDTGNVISPLIFSRKDWETRHSVTPFYKNVKREGVLL
jgi:predicted nucleotidyltransferase